jgi:cullin 3
MRCAVFLADYVDDLLKNALRENTEGEADSKLDKFIVMFRFLLDKDIFESYYKQALSKRLLSGKSVSDDLEKAMIGKMKAECGATYVTNLEGMFTDMQLSKDVAEGFKASPEAQQLPSQMRLEMSTLTAGFWPIPSTPPCHLPSPHITDCVRIFDSYYSRKFEGRKIVWVTHHGNAELRAAFPEYNGKPKHSKHFTVTTYQMAILMQFNRNDQLSFNAIHRATGIISIVDLKRHLLSLCTRKAPLLVKDSKVKGISETDSFAFNKAFQSKQSHVKIPMIALKEVTGADDNGSLNDNGDGNGSNGQSISAAVEKDRAILVEASIVRIMKTRKTMMHNELLAEVVRQVSGRFTPEPAFIKKRIETLLEREYLARDAEDGKCYVYVA